MGNSLHFVDSCAISTDGALSDVGPKAANLLRLAAAGFNVPPFFAISPQLFEQSANLARPEIEGILDSIDADKFQSIESAAMKIEDIVNAINLPTEIEREIRQRAFEVGDGGLLAVRSSNSDEDSHESSFAGLYDSFVAVAPDDVVDQIKAVWASSWSPRSLLYRSKKGLSWKKLAPGAIVQVFVNARASGVVFSVDPTGGDGILIDSAFGLGDGVTGGFADTDSYRVSREGMTIERQVSHKTLQVLKNPKGAGIKVEQVGDNDSCRPVLTDNEIEQIRATTLEVEGYFGSPQDIEWSFYAEKLWILQSRPIVGRPAAGGWLGVWDSANISESYPRTTLPLTYSFIRIGYRVSFENALCFLLPFAKARVRQCQATSQLLGYFGGRVYMNLLNWYLVLSHLPTFERHRPVWDRMIGVNGQVECERAKLRSFDWMIAWIMLAWVFLGNRFYVARFARSFEAFYKEAQSKQLDRLDERRLVAFFRDCRSCIQGLWHLPLLNDHCAMVWLSLLEHLCQGRQADISAPSINDLLRGTGKIASAEPVAAIETIARSLQALPHADRILTTSAEDALSIVQTDRRFADISQMIDKYLQSFGDRRIEELKLECPSLRECPSFLMAQILAVTRAPHPFRAVDSAPNVSKFAPKGVGLIRRALIYFVRRQTVAAIANREAMRMDRARMFGLVRRVFLRIGTIWEKNGELDSRNDVFWLTVEEVFDRIEACGTTQNLNALVQLRRKEIEASNSEKLPDRFETRDLPNPPSDQPDELPDGCGMIEGIGCSSGNVKGRAKIISDPRSAVIGHEDILVAKSTDPGWVFLMTSARGLIVENGSPLSHTAIIGRELGIPTVVGAKGATSIIPNGAIVRLNACEGRISWN